MKNTTLSIFVPCFNEEKNITTALNNIREAIENINYEILVVNDGSADKTGDMAEKFKKDNPSLNIKIFHNEKNVGLGSMYYLTAFKASGKYYMLVNGDAVDPPSEIKKIVKNLGKADMILPNLIDRRSVIRKIVSKLFVIIVNLITFNNLKYYNGQALHLVENVKLYGTKTHGFGYQAELITNLLLRKKTYLEITIKDGQRLHGTSTAFSPRNILSVINTIINIFLRQIIYSVKKILKIK